jgi:hypothetical protein
MTDYGTGYKALHVDALLANRALIWRNNAFVGSQICPEISVEKASDKYTIFNKERFQWVNTARTDKADIMEYEETWTTDTYSTKGYALGKKVSRKQRMNADQQVARLISGVDDLREKIELDKEVRIKTLAEVSTSFYTGHSVTIGTDAIGDDPTAGWDKYNDADSHPERDVSYACETIEAASGMEPNTLLIGYKAARKLAMHPDIRALYKRTDNLQLNQRTGLPDVLWGLNIVPTRAKYSTVKKGQTVTLSNLWTSTVAIVCYVSPRPLADEPTWLANFAWGQWEAEQNYLPTKKCDFITLESPEWDEKLISNLLAFKFSSVITA